MYSVCKLTKQLFNKYDFFAVDIVCHKCPTYNIHDFQELVKYD